MMLEVRIKKHDILSDKEESVFKLLAKGMTYQAIAEHTSRSEDTVKTHAKAIREKLHAKSIVQAVAIAVANGIVSIKQVGKNGIFSIFLILGAQFFGDDNVIRNQRLSRPNLTRSREI